MNAICEGDGKKSPNFIVVFLLGTVTLGIYYLYWWYRQGCRIQEAAPRYGVHVRESGAVILIWQILGATLMMGIGSLLGTYIMVDNVNRIALGYNGEATAEELRNMRKPHPKAVRNALIVYRVLVVFAISMLVAGIAAFTSLGLTEDTTQSINTEAYADDSDSDSEPAPDKSEPAENPEASEDNSAEAAEPAPAEPAAKVVTLPVTVVNNTGVDIIELYASSTDSDDWEDDILGDDILDAGGVFHINFQFPADETKWDFAIVDENDNELEFYDLDFANCSTAGATLTLNYDGTTAHATLN